jgi:hypothetical protein
MKCVICEATETSKAGWYWKDKGTPTCSKCYSRWYRQNHREKYLAGVNKRNSTDKAKKRRRDYEKTQKGRIARSKYNTSLKKSVSNKKYNQKPESKVLKRIKVAERRRTKDLSRPEWLTGDLLEEYKNKIRACAEMSTEEVKYTIDHIIPLKSDLVCGLDVPWNIQILTLSENSSKSNKFDGTYDNETWRKHLEEGKCDTTERTFDTSNL